MNLIVQAFCLLVIMSSNLVVQLITEQYFGTWDRADSVSCVALPNRNKSQDRRITQRGK